MAPPVAIAELRRNLRTYLRRVEGGERLLVTNRDRPVAELRPPPPASRAISATLERLIADGRVRAPDRAMLPTPLSLPGDPGALIRALSDIRGEG